jgi:branched-chain amino acid transport system permease protein
MPGRSGSWRHVAFWVLQILNGVSFGLLLFLLAAGLSLIYGLMRILNLAHGSYYLLGAYVGLSVVQSTGSFVLAAVCAVVVVTGVGIAMERLFLARIPRQELPQALLTFGFLLIFGDLALWIWGGSKQKLPLQEIL